MTRRGGVDPTAEIVDRLLALPPRDRLAAIRAMTPAQRREFRDRWAAWAHDGQLAPPGDWRVWLIRAGRGFGKTRAGAEWLGALARATPDGRFALVGATVADVRRVMIEGPSGLIALAREHEPLDWQVVPDAVRVVVGVDPPAGVGGDACGVVAVALGGDGRGYVLEDASVVGATPEGWARAVAACAARRGADRVVAEKNQGGEMVRATLLAADAALPVRLVHASRGKAARAEPVAALYEAGKVWHAGAFPALEDEMCGLQAGGGYQGPGRSPDRADALVWALTELMLGRRGAAAIRGL